MLTEFKFGESFRIIEFLGEPLLQQRMMELGIHQGSCLTFFAKAPFSGPAIFRSGSTMFAFREEELQCLRLKKI